MLDANHSSYIPLEPLAAAIKKKKVIKGCAVRKCSDYLEEKHK